MTSKRIALKSSEAKQLLQEFERKFPGSVSDLHAKQVVEEIVVEDGKLYILDGKPFAIFKSGQLYPSLVNDEVLRTLPTIVVDMGAIPHICNGADIMRPGIREIQSQFSKGAVLLIKDIKFGKSIGICVAEFSSDSMQSMTKGKVAQNVHYVGDRFWQALKSS